MRFRFGHKLVRFCAAPRKAIALSNENIIMRWICKKMTRKSHWSNIPRKTLITKHLRKYINSLPRWRKIYPFFSYLYWIIWVRHLMKINYKTFQVLSWMKIYYKQSIIFMKTMERQTLTERVSRLFITAELEKKKQWWDI